MVFFGPAFITDDYNYSERCIFTRKCLRAPMDAYLRGRLFQ